MRKLLLAAVLVLVAGACNKDYNDTDAGYGSLKVSAVIDQNANINPETYFLTLQSDEGIAYNKAFPVGGEISDLPAGTYVGKLKSEAAEFAVPVFESPFYSTTVNNIVITSGGTTSVEFVCKQTNTGVKFIYDSSLGAAGYSNITPVITQSGHSLSYSGANKTSTGYFTAGNATLKLLNGDVPIMFGGSLTEIPLTLESKDPLTITLKAIVASDKHKAVITDTDATHRSMEITIGATVISTVFSESFANCTGTNYPIAGETFNSSGYAGSLASESALIRAGLSEWTLESAYSCNNGLKMGVTAGNGIAITPQLEALGTTPTNVTLTFMAANWETAQRTLRVGVTGDGSVVSPAGGTINLPSGTANGNVISTTSAMRQYTVTIEGATKDTRIVFSPSSSSGSNRYFLADVNVFFIEE